MSSQNLSSRRSAQLLLILYTIGLLASVVLIAGSVGHPAFGRVCELTGADCAAVTSSEWGSVFGVSWASLGLAWFAAMLALRLIGLLGFISVPERLLRVVHLGALVIALYLSGLMFSGVTGVCSLCLLVHAVNVLATLILFMWRVALDTANHDKISRPAWVPLQLVVCLFLLVLCAANWWLTTLNLNATNERIVGNLQYWQFLHRQQPKHSFIPKEGDEAFDLDGEGFHQIVLIYKDGCQHCKRAKEYLGNLARNNSDTVYVIFKNINSLSVARLHEIGVKGAPAVFLNGRLAEGWEVSGFFREVLGDECDC